MAIVHIKEPKISHFLFSNSKSSLLWLILRLYVGYEWFIAGWEKIHNPVWVGSDAGTALAGFVKGALGKTAGSHPDVQGWYAWFLNHVVLPHPVVWSHVISYGEALVGVALIIGLFTGIAAFFGLFMNLNYLLAGTVSTNPILFTAAIGLILAWKVAGYIGLDRWVMPKLGTPWEPGTLFHSPEPVLQTTPQNETHDYLEKLSE